MPNETLRPLHKHILAAPVVGAGGNHSARLARVVENLLEMDESQRPDRVNHLLARIGGFAGGLAQDLRSGGTTVADAAQLLDQLSAVGDWAFSQWSEKDGRDRYRRSLCEPAPAIFVAAGRLSEAVELHNAGDRAGAEELFRLADDADVRAFTEQGWGKGAAARYGFVATDDSPAYLPKDLRPMPRMPWASTMILVLDRDGRHCRFCGIPVISAAVRRRVQVVYPAAVT